MPNLNTCGVTLNNEARLTNAKKAVPLHTIFKDKKITL